jgi:hypothetical protein
MNERIRELYYQCQDESLSTEECYHNFAELIVRECVKVMYDNAIERKVPPDINQTPTHYAIAVLEHFGVDQ